MVSSYGSAFAHHHGGNERRRQFISREVDDLPWSDRPFILHEVAGTIFISEGTFSNENQLKATSELCNQCKAYIFSCCTQ